MKSFTIEQVTGNDWIGFFLTRVMTDSTKEGEDFLKKFKLEHDRPEADQQSSSSLREKR
jgi:hypothetical protein